MISVRCLGHIGTSVGSKEVQLQGDELRADEIVQKLRELSGMKDPGFTAFNTLVMVEDGEAFIPAGSERTLRSGEKVVLIPFSHGG